MHLGLESLVDHSEGKVFLPSLSNRSLFAVLSVWSEQQQPRAEHTLGESSFDLPDVDQGVNTPANIHMDIGSKNRPIAGQSVDLDFTDRCTLICKAAQRCTVNCRQTAYLREVKEGFTFLGNPIETDVRSLVVAHC